MAAEEVTDQSGHVDYPHEAGYLVDCPGCESGPCVCSVPCSDAECVEGGKHAPGARFQHYAPCNSEDCEHPESTEPDREEIEREYAYTSGALASEDAARVEFTYYAQRISASASTDEDMSMTVPFETVITSIERRINSRNGNPKWRITTPLGTWDTAADVQDAYKLNYSDAGKRVRINAFSGRKYLHISNIDVWTRFPDGSEDWY